MEVVDACRMAKGQQTRVFDITKQGRPEKNGATFVLEYATHALLPYREFPRHTSQRFAQEDRGVRASCRLKAALLDAGLLKRFISSLVGRKLRLLVFTGGDKKEGGPKHDQTDSHCHGIASRLI